MAPTTLPSIVARRKPLAGRTALLGALALLHVHRNFSLRQGKLHTANLPRAPDTENLGIKVFVSHGKSA